MKSAIPKVLHRVAGRPMLEFVIRASIGLSPRSVTVVVGHMAESVGDALRGRPEIRVVVQEPQLGTGHALLQTAPVLESVSGSVVLLSGDVPLLRSDTLLRIAHTHRDAGAAATVLTALVRPAGTDTAGSCERTARLLALSRNETRRRQNGSSKRSIAASMPSSSRGCLQHYGGSERKTLRGSTIFRI